jgi:hypothetical protein
MKRLDGLDEPRIPLNYTTVGNDANTEEK